MSTPRLDATIPTSIHVVRRERESRPSYLDQTEGCGAPRRINLEKEEIIVGRQSDADIVLESQRASRRHAVIHRLATDYVLRDDDSHNGIFLNGIRIHSVTLREGDVIHIADCAFVFHED